MNNLTVFIPAFLILLVQIKVLWYTYTPSHAESQESSATNLT